MTIHVSDNNYNYNKAYYDYDGYYDLEVQNYVFIIQFISCRSFVMEDIVRSIYSIDDDDNDDDNYDGSIGGGDGNKGNDRDYQQVKFKLSQ